MVAARELLEEGGYDALTMEAVAGRAGVGKPTVYRRWSTRAQLVFELLSGSNAPDPVPDTGSVRGDILEIARWFVAAMQAADRKIIGDRMGEVVANPCFAGRVREHRLVPDREAMMAVWSRALERGEVLPEADGDAVIDDLVGILVYRVLIRHLEVDETELERLVARHLDAVLVAQATRSS